MQKTPQTNDSQPEQPARDAVAAEQPSLELDPLAPTRCACPRCAWQASLYATIRAAIEVKFRTRHAAKLESSGVFLRRWVSVLMFINAARAEHAALHAQGLAAADIQAWPPTNCIACGLRAASPAHIMRCVNQKVRGTVGDEQPHVGADVPLEVELRESTRAGVASAASGCALQLAVVIGLHAVVYAVLSTLVNCTIN